MADFRNKIFGLAGALLCAGAAYAQGPATCAAPTTPGGAALIRAEGTTEQVASITFVCTAPAAGSNAGPVNVQIFLTPALPVTSKVLSTTTGATEATLTLTPTGGAAVVAQGTIVGGTSLNFSLTAPAIAGAGTYTFVVTNVRVNATSLAVSSGVPPTVTETPFISGGATTVNPAALAATTVAFAQTAFSTNQRKQAVFGAGTFPTTASTNTSGTNGFVICNAYSPRLDLAAGFATAAAAIAGGFTSGVGGTAAGGRSMMSVINVSENFASSFRTAADEASQTAAAVGAVTNAVSSGTRVKLVFNNVPSNVTLLVPNGAINSQNGGGAAKITLTGSETGPFAAVTASTASGAFGLPLAAVTVASGTGTAVFEVTTDDLTNLDSYWIPVYVITTANSVPGSSTAITTSVSLAPVGSTNIPNFAVGASTTAITGAAFNLCSTSLLFTFVTNQLGFDTGIAISNTSTDPFGTLGATPQAGTCTLNFYGNGAPTPNNVTTANIPSGTVYAAPLSSVAAGFQGYMIAQCQFQFAHGFAFITDGVGVNGGLSQGYLAGVIPDVNQGARGANDGSKAVAGAGETLGN